MENLDPMITSFNMICDRLSAMEEDISSMKINKQNKGLLKNGNLCRSLFKLPFEVFNDRSKDDDEFDNHTCSGAFFSANLHCSCEMMKKEKIYKFVPSGTEIIHAEENFALQNGYPDEHLSCREFNLPSLYQDVYEEALKRYLLSVVKDDIVQDLILLDYCEFLSFGLIANTKTNMFDFLKEAIKVIYSMGHVSTCVKELQMERCETDIFKVYSLCTMMNKTTGTERDVLKDQVKMMLREDFSLEAKIGEIYEMKSIHNVLDEFH
jgi:hypothetical protein